MTGIDRQQLLRDLARSLWEAEEAARPVEPPTERHADLDVADAYTIQSHNVERRVSGGAQVVGRKVGLTSRPMQRQLGVHEPDFGVLLDDSDLAGRGVSTATVLAAIAGVLPAIEIVDSRVVDWRIQLVDTIADNASSGRLVVGGRLTLVAGVDLPLVGMLLYRNGVPIDSGAGAAALGNPARCVAWLANKLGTLGSGLRRDDLVLPGALHRMVPVRPGDVFRAEFAHLGSVMARFSDGGGSM